MIAKSLISPEIPVLSLSDTGEKALKLMSEYRVFHLPLVQRDNYLALISEDDLLDWDTPEEPLSLAEFVNFRPLVFEQAHPYEAIKIAKEFNLTVLPVVDEQKHYSGVITIEGLFAFAANQNAITEIGGIITLEMEHRNYSLSEIARLCESNDISILNVQIENVPDSSKQLVTLKLNKTDLKSLIATFERYSYQVNDVFAADDNANDLKSNYDALMHYINQ